jgi:hypothetical protein
MRAETGDLPREIILHNFDAGRLLCVATIIVWFQQTIFGKEV